MELHRQRQVPSPVFTGVGAVSSLGQGIESLWRSLKAGISVMTPISLFSTDGHRTSVAAEVQVFPRLNLTRIKRNLLSRADILAIAASMEALRDSGLLDLEKGAVYPSYSRRLGIVVGTAAGGILGLEEFFRSHRTAGVPSSQEALLSSFCLSAVATNIAKEFLIDGPRLTVATVCSSSGLALAAAKELLEGKEIDQVLVVGTETLSEVVLAGFNSLRSVSPDLCRPFDRNRKGIILGEGAGAVVLESPSSALSRKAQQLAYFRGYGLTTDLHHFTAPQPEGLAIARTLNEALRDASLPPGAIDYISAHGTATTLNDVAETRGIKGAFGSHAHNLAISSIKSMLGHQLGAASIFQIIATILAMKHDTIPPTTNLENPDPECDLEYTPCRALQKPINHCLSNSFAFGGSNISLVLSKTESEWRESQSSAGHFLETIPVITGIGLVSPIGKGKRKFRQSLVENKHGLVNLSSFGEEWAHFKGGLVNEIAIRDSIPAIIRRRLNRQACFLFLSMKEALNDARIAESEGAEIPIAYGTAFGCSGNVHRFYSQILRDGPRFCSPQEFNMSVTNAPPSLVAKEFGLKGPLWVFVSDEVSWEISFQWAAMLIRQGRAHQVIVSGAEEISDSILAIHRALGLLETKTRKGLTLGEGSISMVLESAINAKNRGAPMYGSVAAWDTFQDSKCGPQEFPQDKESILPVCFKCIETIDRNKSGPLFWINPGNENIPSTMAASEALNEFEKRSDFEFKSASYHSKFGDSGISGGLALSAGLLGIDGENCEYILTVTNARGGISAACLVRKFFKGKKVFIREQELRTDLSHINFSE